MLLSPYATAEQLWVASDRPIAQVTLDQAGPATAELVGDYEVLIRGRVLGETHLKVITRDGHASLNHVTVRSEAARTLRGSLASR